MKDPDHRRPLLRACGLFERGYFAGLVATLASRTLAVRLLKPPPLDTELAVRNLETVPCSRACR